MNAGFRTRMTVAAAAGVFLAPIAGGVGLAQVPTGSAAQLERGRSVAEAAWSPNPIEIVRGDTILFTVSFTDSAGVGIPAGGTQFGIARNPADFGLESIKDSIADTYLIWGTQPGRWLMQIWVQVPNDSAGEGVPEHTWIQLDSTYVTVNDWPVARIAIHEPAHGAYAGTAFPMTASVMTTRDTEHHRATVTWQSRNPGIATITPKGIASFHKPGRVTLRATTESGITADYDLRVVESPVRQVNISPRFVETRTGDVVHFDVAPLDQRGRRVDDIALSFAVSSLDSAGAEIDDDGAFVAEYPGSYRVVVTAGTLAQEAFVVAASRTAPATVKLVGRVGPADVATSDLWIFEGTDGRDYAYTGTHAEGGGNRMYVWDVTDPGNLVLVDSVVVDGRVVNDVKVNADASWAIITREGASSRRNGIVVLDLSVPAHPTILAELTDSLTAGIHNVWINGNVVYAVNDGTNAMNILDLSDPANPRHAGRWEVRPGEQDKSLHDVWADGRYAYLSYWDDGLVILDVGAGTHGGTPTKPAFVSRIAYGMGNTHTAYREGDYVFVGDEIFGCEECVNGPRGYIHVMDVSDIESPREVARFEVPEAGAHNIWVENGVLYIAYYQGGLRIVDVSGELRGDLYAQGRQIGWYQTAATEEGVLRRNAAMAWGPQLFKGNIFVSDMNSGLWVLRHRRAAALSP